jgi:rhodanese-related sulfurtransferase
MPYRLGLIGARRGAPLHRRGRCNVTRLWLLIFALAAAPAAPDDAPVNLISGLPSVEVRHEGRSVRIERNPDPLNQIDADYALTSRACPPFCIQPMQILPGVETVGEIELIEFLRRMSAGDDSILVVDSRSEDWPSRSGIIPGAVVIPWTRLHAEQSSAQEIATLIEERFGATRDGPLWDFRNAKTLVLYCNGPWCGQSPTNIRSLAALGYPPHKLKWYRGGMQSWKSLGLTTVPYPTAPAPAEKPSSP